jgi:hypothetical protein
MKTFIFAMAVAAFTGVISADAARAQDAFTTTIKDHRFDPAEIRVPVGKAIILNVVNDDPTPEEFESRVLKVEKVIPGKTKGVVRFGPLKAGRYPFEGEFNSSTAKGVVIAE